MLRAYRIWRVVEQDNKFVLSSLIFSGTIWPAGQALKAMCLSDAEMGERGEVPAPTHLAPDNKCDCGIYSMLDPTRMWNKGVPDKVRKGDWVIGKVGVWGFVIPHQMGYRSEFGKILEIYPFMFADRVFQISKLYNVPIADYKEEPWAESVATV